MYVSQQAEECPPLNRPVTETKSVPWSAKYLFRPSPATLGSGFGNLLFIQVLPVVSQQDTGRNSFSHGSSRNQHQFNKIRCVFITETHYSFCKLSMRKTSGIFKTFQINELSCSPISETKANKSQIRIATTNILLLSRRRINI